MNCRGMFCSHRKKKRGSDTSVCTWKGRSPPGTRSECRTLCYWTPTPANPPSWRIFASGSERTLSMYRNHSHPQLPLQSVPSLCTAWMTLNDLSTKGTQGVLSTQLGRDKSNLNHPRATKRYYINLPKLRIQEQSRVSGSHCSAFLPDAISLGLTTG